MVYFWNSGFHPRNFDPRSVGAKEIPVSAFSLKKLDEMKEWAQLKMDMGRRIALREEYRDAIYKREQLNLGGWDAPESADTPSLR